jgi:hypothetical protein
VTALPRVSRHDADDQLVTQLRFGREPSSRMSLLLTRALSDATHAALVDVVLWLCSSGTVSEGSCARARVRCPTRLTAVRDDCVVLQRRCCRNCTPLQLVVVLDAVALEVLRHPVKAQVLRSGAFRMRLLASVLVLVRVVTLWRRWRRWTPRRLRRLLQLLRRCSGSGLLATRRQRRRVQSWSRPLTALERRCSQRADGDTLHFMSVAPRAVLLYRLRHCVCCLITVVRVVVQLMYLGEKYNGLARQDHTQETVEVHMAVLACMSWHRVTAHGVVRRATCSRRSKRCR